MLLSAGKKMVKSTHYKMYLILTEIVALKAEFLTEYSQMLELDQKLAFPLGIFLQYVSHFIKWSWRRMLRGINAETFSLSKKLPKKNQMDLAKKIVNSHQQHNKSDATEKTNCNESNIYTEAKLCFSTVAPTEY